MNSFTRAQRGIIQRLAEAHYDATFPFAEHPKLSALYREKYVDAIILGLTDPDIWGRK